MPVQRIPGALLKRRGQAWEEAIAILEAGEFSEADRERVVQLLKRSAGGE